jgi:hypothetical protein
LSRGSRFSAGFYISDAYDGAMKVDSCPKNLNHCPEASCPLYPCWAYDQHMDGMDKDKKERDSGWE